MKISLTSLMLLLFLTSVSRMLAQNISCNDFCVTSMRMDTFPETLVVSIFFSGDENDFINYPHIKAVTNAQGDTIATGDLTFFGQFGNTEYEYYLDARIDTIPSDLIATIEFKYDTNTCLLDYPCLDDPTNEWFPIGANWYYNQVIFVPPYNGFVHFQVTDTTVINNKIFKKINGGCNCSEMSGPLYQDGDKIFAYVSDSLTLLYDFTLVAGDTLNIYMGSEGTSHFLIDSITTYQAGPLTLRVQHIHYLDGNHHEWGTKIYERVGSNGCLFPTNGVCDPATGGLRCYEDEITGLLNFNFPESPCDFISAIDDPIDPNIKVYPNPAVDLLHIESDVQMNSIELIHLSSGITYLNQVLSANSTYQDIHAVPPGAFLLRIVTDDGKMISRKVIITGRTE